MACQVVIELHSPVLLPMCTDRKQECFLRRRSVFQRRWSVPGLWDSTGGRLCIMCQGSEVVMKQQVKLMTGISYQNWRKLRRKKKILFLLCLILRLYMKWVPELAINPKVWVTASDGRWRQNWTMWSGDVLRVVVHTCECGCVLLADTIGTRQKTTELFRWKATVSGIISKDRSLGISLFFLTVSQLHALLVTGTN